MRSGPETRTCLDVTEDYDDARPCAAATRATLMASFHGRSCEAGVSVREAGEGGRCQRMSSPTTPMRLVGFCVCRRVIVPPPPRTSAVVDPRIGDPAGVAGAGGRHGLPGRRVRRPDRWRRRPGREHQPDRLPGGLHGSVVRRPGRRHDLSADRQLRAARRRRPVLRPWLRALVVANATAAVLEPRGSSSRCCATRPSRRSPAWTRGPGPPSARERQPARDRPAPAMSTCATVGERGGDALGGPGLRWPGVAAESTDTRRRRRRTAVGIVDWASRRTSSGRCASAAMGARPPAHGLGVGRLVGDIDGVILSPGPGDPARLEGRSPWPAPPSTTAGRCWASAWATRSSAVPPAPIRAVCGSGITGRTTRSRTWSSGASR